MQKKKPYYLNRTSKEPLVGFEPTTPRLHRTNDPEITNHVLWPTELKRRVGKLTISRRYNQLTFAAIKPWRIRKELAVWDLPIFQR